MEMNKQGFTLVELLATIVIISIVSGIAVISYNSIIRQSSNSVFESYCSTVSSDRRWIGFQGIPSHGMASTVKARTGPSSCLFGGKGMCRIGWCSR